MASGVETFRSGRLKHPRHPTVLVEPAERRHYTINPCPRHDMLDYGVETRTPRILDDIGGRPTYDSEAFSVRRGSYLLQTIMMRSCRASFVGHDQRIECTHNGTLDMLIFDEISRVPRFQSRSWNSGELKEYPGLLLLLLGCYETPSAYRGCSVCMNRIRVYPLSVYPVLQPQLALERSLPLKCLPQLF